MTENERKLVQALLERGAHFADIEKMGVVIEGYFERYGDKFWFKEGKLHREDGPAVIEEYGIKRWYKEGKLHRLDGPAIVCPDGTEYWFKEGDFIV